MGPCPKLPGEHVSIWVCCQLHNRSRMVLIIRLSTQACWKDPTPCPLPVVPKMSVLSMSFQVLSWEKDSALIRFSDGPVT